MRGDKRGYKISYFDEKIQSYIKVNIDKYGDKFMETDNILRKEKKFISPLAPYILCF